MNTYRRKRLVSLMLVIFLTLPVVTPFFNTIIAHANVEAVLLIGDSRLYGMYDDFTSKYYVAAFGGSGVGDMTSDGKITPRATENKSNLPGLSKIDNKNTIDLVGAAKKAKIKTIVWMMGRNDTIGCSGDGKGGSDSDIATAKKAADTNYTMGQTWAKAIGANVIYAEVIKDGDICKGCNKCIDAFNTELKSKAGSVIELHDCRTPGVGKAATLHPAPYTGAIDKVVSAVSSGAGSNGSDSGSKMSALDFGKKVATGPMSGCGFDDEHLEALGESVGLVIQVLRTSGWTDEAIAGVCANMQHESQFDPFCFEGCYLTSTSYFDLYLAYKKGTKKATIKNDISGTYGGLGLIGFTYISRHETLSKYCKENGGDFELTMKDMSYGSKTWEDKTWTLGTTGTQVAYMLTENGGKGSWNHNEGALQSGALPTLENGLQDLAKLTDAEKVCKYFGVCMEVMQGYNEGVPEQRAKDAPAWLTLVKAYSGTSGSAVDKQDATNTAQQLVKAGYWSEEELSAFCKLAEININDVYLKDATMKNLNTKDVQSVVSWRDNVQRIAEENGVVKVMRRLVMALGIFLTVYIILVYVSYWVDRLNNFIEVDCLAIITLGKLRISDTEDECTYRLKDLGNGKTKTVNHRAILSITITGLAFAALILTGVLFDAIMWVVMKITNMLS